MALYDKKGKGAIDPPRPERASKARPPGAKWWLHQNTTPWLRR
jgi:hypothetical protein